MKVAIIKVFIKLLVSLVTVAAGTFIAVVIFAAASISTKIAMTAIVLTIALEMMSLGFIWGDDPKHHKEEE